MAGASPEHNLICKNVIVTFDTELEALGVDCDVFGSDQKVYIRRRKIYLPDAVVACNGQFDENDCLRNPVLISEVLSHSTSDFDQDAKFRDYRSLPSLEHYVLVRQDRPGVLHYAKADGGLWAIVGDYTRLDDSLSLNVGGATVSVSLSRIYRRIDFGPEVLAQDEDDETASDAT